MGAIRRKSFSSRSRMRAISTMRERLWPIRPNRDRISWDELKKQLDL